MEDKYLKALLSFTIYDKEFLPDLYKHNRFILQKIVNMLAIHSDIVSIVKDKQEVIEFLDGNGFQIVPTAPSNVVKLIPQYSRTIYIDGKRYEITIDTSGFPTPTPYEWK